MFKLHLKIVCIVLMCVAVIPCWSQDLNQSPCSKLLSAASEGSDSAVACKALDFKETKVYSSPHEPGYTSWVSFFPGWNGEWYLTCEEVSRPDKPLPQQSMEDWFAMGFPVGYDKSQYLMEVVMLESKDGMKTWNEISRQPVRYQHSAGSFGQAKMKNGDFLRFMWECYSLEPDVEPNECMYRSTDNGRTWRKMPTFLDAHMAYYPHRLRILRDGTLVLACPSAPKWKHGTEWPERIAMDLSAVSEMQMMLYFSFDEGNTWQGPLPILAGATVSETDFVELPDGNLLFISNSIFPNAGRQIVYRDGRRFTPGFYQKAVTNSCYVPETVCLTETGVLVGCMRNAGYAWSDDYGLTWWPLEGTRNSLYQPWIQYLGDGNIVCAGHLGADDPIKFLNEPGKGSPQYIGLQTFKLQTGPKKELPKLVVERLIDVNAKKALNSYAVKLTVGGKPLPNKKVEFWYVKRYEPGYDWLRQATLEERMKTGGKLLTLTTDSKGAARVDLPELDKVTNIHQSIQIVARFNADRSDPKYVPVQTPQLEYYCLAKMDEPLEVRGQ